MRCGAAPALAILALACVQGGLDAPRALPSPDQAYFRCKVQPVIARTCAFYRCHGDGRRFFRIYARNRLRLDKTEETRNEPLADLERRANYESARAMIDAERPADSLLLRKPLDRRAPNGRFHRAAEMYPGDDVFADEADPDWQMLAAWVGGATADPTCEEPESSL